MKILILDNYDSFTYNLVQLTREIAGDHVVVAKNDEISLEEAGAFQKIILSPGPGVPSEAGILLDVIKRYAPVKSMLGVCLGQQAIAEAFGGSLVNLRKIYHGVATPTHRIKDCKLLRGLPETIEAGRYHSWAVNTAGFPDVLEVTSVDDEGMIMSLQHKIYDVHGVQYHPESVLTPAGKQILANFLCH